MNRNALNSGVGCAALVPAAFIGLAGLVDYAGPKGWLGFAEIFGWLAICFAAARLIRAVLNTVGPLNLKSAVSTIALVVGICAFTAATVWLGLDAPQEAKDAFTTILQTIGIGAGIASLFFAARVVRDQR